MAILLGCIADDFTGATDLANNLVRAGMRVVQTIGTPTQPLSTEVDAVVIALKSRTLPASIAVAQSLAALQWLQAQGAQQIYFKYCSTFDSTPSGNIGPVCEALMDALACDFTIATPAFPDNGRTVFNGYLFVGAALLNESGMQHHPLTPMTDANLVRVLQAQTRRQVGLIDHACVAQGVAAIRARIAALKAAGVGIAIVDAVSNDDLLRLGPALADLPLVTAGSGVAIALPANFAVQPQSEAAQLPAASGYQAVLSGSCSSATQAQVAHAVASGMPALALDPLHLASLTATSTATNTNACRAALAWAREHIAHGPVLIYATADPATVQAVQARLGSEHAGALIEQTLAAIARGLLELGVRQLIVAGGETSGACVQALEITQLRIGGQIDPGVPWCHAASPLSTTGLHIALKSGNFGSVDFFCKAFTDLQS